jgi:murein DD-endopeptidase MepM/ murein hydrolase activator NlpD
MRRAAIAQGGLAALVVLLLSACASAGGAAPIEQRSGVGVEATAPTRRPVPPADPARVSSMPSVQEAAALKPESGRRPGGTLRQPKDDPAARRVRVSVGQSLYDISRAYSVNLRALIETNRLSPPYALEAGETVLLPAPVIHVVERGETLFTISERFNIDTRSLAVMNSLPRPWRVWPGDELKLPPLVRDQWASGPEPRLAARPPAEPGTVVASRTTRPSPKPVRTAPSAPNPVRSPPPAPVEAAVGPGPASFVWPVSGRVLKSYGSDASGYRNEGIDISAPRGAPVRATADGEVVYAGDDLAGLGNLLLLKHVDGWVSAYAHADALLVKVGQSVRQGQVIAEAGLTGRASQPQVHFQLRRGKTAVDPQIHLPKLAS